MLAKLNLACWVGCIFALSIHSPLLAANNFSIQQRTMTQEITIEPARLEQILDWVSQTWEVPRKEVRFDYEKDQLLISPSPDQTFWKINYRGGCAIVDLADLL